MIKKRVLAGLAALMMTMVLDAPLQVIAKEPMQVMSEGNETNPGEDKLTFASVQNSGIQLTLTSNQQTPQYNYGEKKDLKMTLTNTGDSDAEGVTITPNIEAGTSDWPFEIENKEYQQEIGTLKAGESVAVTYSFQAREDVSTQYYKLGFTINYQQGDEQMSIQNGVYVKTKAKPAPAPDNTGDNNGNGASGSNQNPSGGGADDSDGGSALAAAGGISNSDPVSSNGETSGSVPRVIVTGFTTNPGDVIAGSNFQLVVKVKNTSSSTAVKNMTIGFTAPTEGKDENTAPAFLPSSGANTLYIDQIAAGAEKDVTIDLNAKQDLVQKPYSLDLAMKYEDKANTQYDSSSSVAIPIKQAARFEFSEIQINPESIAVGEEANVTANMYNLGKVKLYNVKVKLEGKSVSAAESFIGNVESGSTASIDLMVKGEKETASPEKVKMIMSYEDGDGKIGTAEKEFSISVTPAMEEMPVMEDMEVEQKTFPLIPVVGGVIAVAVIGILIFKKIRKGKETVDDEMDGPFEDE